MSPEEKSSVVGTGPVQLGAASKLPGEMLRLRSEFDHVRSHGSKQVGKFMLLVTSPSPAGKLRFGIICGRKYSKKAVLRNRARRLLKESFRLLKAGLVPLDCLLVARQAMANAKMQEVQQDLIRLLKRAKAFKPDSLT